MSENEKNADNFSDKEKQEEKESNKMEAALDE